MSLSNNDEYWRFLKNHKHNEKKNPGGNYYEVPKYGKDHDKYLNAQMNFVGTVECSKSFGKAQSNGNPKRCTFELPKYDQGQKKYCYKNFRINLNDDEQKLINSCVIDAGDYDSIDRIYGRVFKVLRHLYEIEDSSVLPFGFSNKSNQNWKDGWVPMLDRKMIVGMDLEDLDLLNSLELTVDIYELLNLDPIPKLLTSSLSHQNHSTFDYRGLQLQFFGEETLMKGMNHTKIRQPFINIVTHLIFEIPEIDYTDGRGIVIQLNGYDFIVVDEEDSLDKCESDETSCNLKYIKKYDNHLIIPTSIESLNGGINFTKIDNCTFCLKFKDFDEPIKQCRIYAINWQEYRSGYGMFGISYKY